MRRRKVFYVPGFDPHGAGRYHGLYKTEAAKQAAWSGYDLEIDRAQVARYGARWSVTAHIDGTQVATDYECLKWNDLVSARLRRPLWRRITGILTACARATANLSLAAMCRKSMRATLPILYPLIGVAVYVALAGCIVLAFALGAAQAAAPLAPVVSGLLTAAGGLAGLWAARAFLRWTDRMDRHVFVYYLSELFLWVYVALSRGQAADLDARIDLFADRIAAAAGEDWDEVLVVGHSSGCPPAGLALARALAQIDGEPGPALSLLTLGQPITALLTLPAAASLRAEFAALATDSRATWVDASSLADGACFALVDPLDGYGPAPETRQSGPKVISVNFRATMGEEAYKDLRRRYYRIHFQYLYAFSYPKDYDYFRITAGPQTLRERFRSTRPVNRAPTPVWSAPPPGSSPP